MKNHHSMSPVSRPRGFTLVELLVVITIIGILVGLTIPAVIFVRIIAKQAAVTLDLKQLEMACQSYKEKFGEYPPDFAGASLPVGDPVGDVAHAAVLRHIRKAFPRCTAVSTWQDFLDETGLPPTQLTPQTALAFWLGGRRAGGQLTGFSANPANPFDTSTSRIGPFFDFDLNRLRADGCYWPQGAVGNMTTGAIVYFRAENGGYGAAGTWALTLPANVFPAIDTRLSNLDNLDNYVETNPHPVYSWVNPRSIQIFSSGLDVMYSSPIPFPGGELNGCLAFPTGENYDPAGQTYDDITNFSDGTLENATP